MSYEESVKKVENIITMLSENELPLEKAVDAFKEGITELEVCRKSLENAKITIKDMGADDDE